MISFRQIQRLEMAAYFDAWEALMSPGKKFIRHIHDKSEMDYYEKRVKHHIKAMQSKFGPKPKNPKRP